MRITIASLCLLMAACGGQNPSSPTSSMHVLGAADASGGPVGVSRTQAQGGTELPFKGSFTQQTRSVFEPPSTRVITGTAEGTATDLGRFTATTESRSTNNTATCTWNFTAANGDQLSTTTVGVANEFIPPNVSKVTLAATIVGGTGRFAGATGTLTIHNTQVIDFATSSSTGGGTIEGQLNLNR
jgi:hypothetical protein